MSRLDRLRQSRHGTDPVEAVLDQFANLETVGRVLKEGIALGAEAEVWLGRNALAMEMPKRV